MGEAELGKMGVVALKINRAEMALINNRNAIILDVLPVTALACFFSDTQRRWRDRDTEDRSLCVRVAKRGRCPYTRVPCARSSLITVDRPFLSMVRIALADKRSVINRFSSANQRRFLTRLG